MKLKDIDPNIGLIADCHGEDYRIVGIANRRGRKFYIGQPDGSHLTYFMDPAKVQIFNPVS